MIMNDRVNSSNTGSTQDQESSSVLLLNQLDQFLYVASKAVSESGGSCILSSEDVATATTALGLLQTLPAARPAALAYLGHLLGKQVSLYMRGGGGASRGEAGPNGADGTNSNGGSNTAATELVQDVEEVLRTLLEAERDCSSIHGGLDAGPGMWCELVCSWGVEVLAVWAADLDQMRGILEEVVGVWLECPAVRTVVGLVAQCVTRDPQGTVAHVLNTASECTPDLDWLVAHIGASHPGPVLAYLLDPSVQVPLETDQLNRTTAILNHLALQHSSAVGHALTSLLERAVQGHCWPGAGPQLLMLVTRSAPLLDTLTSALPSLLAPNTLNRLSVQVSTWVPTYFHSWTHLQQICVQLLLDCAGPSLLHTLLHGLAPALDTSPQSHNLLPVVKMSLTTLLRSLLTELCCLAYARRVNKPRVALLVSLGQPTSGGAQPLAPVLRWALQCGSSPVVRAVAQLVVMSCSQQQQPSESGLWSYLLHTFPPGPDLLHIVARLTLAIVREAQVGGNALERPLADVLTKSGPTLVNAIANVQLLSSGHTLRAPLCDAVSSLLPNLAQLINLPLAGPSVIKLLAKVSLSQPINLANTSSLAHAVTCHLMTALDSEEVEPKVVTAGFCGKLLSQLSSSSCGHGLVTRLIVEAVFRPEWARIFGAQAIPRPDYGTSHISNGSRNGLNKQLLNANYTFDSWVKLPQSHTTIFHAGAIGVGGSSRQPTPRELPRDAVTLNCQLLLNTLCSASKHHDHAPLTIALLLVEIISPDIMYNGFPWPDENIKFTIERDLTIKKTFEDFPIAWELLEFVASSRPALCYCSVLVRALTASYISIWSTSALGKSTESPKQLRATERLLEIMVIGQFLPHNMHVLPQMISHLAPHEVVAVLQDVWDYMRDNTPSPDRWALLPNRQHDRSNRHADPRSFDVCRRLIHFHVQTLGHLLPSMLQQPQQPS